MENLQPYRYIMYKFISAHVNNGIQLMLESVAKYFNDHHYFIRYY